MNWQLQQAKNRLSEVIRQAQTHDAQVITVRGKETAVLVSAQRYRQLIGQKDSLADFMRRSPWAETELDVTRSQDLGRNIQL